MGILACRCACIPSIAAMLLAGCGGNLANVSTPMQSAAGSTASGKRTFKYTGREQSFTVPSGVKSITVVARGASGPKEPGCGGKGRGGRVYAHIPVKQGEKLYVFVGSEFGYNGGGRGGSSSYGIPGGGASDVRGHGDGLTNRILVAGGGGAPGESNNEHEIACGGAGGKVGGTGGTESYSYDDSAGGGGTGGTQGEGGSGGSGGTGIGSSEPGSAGNPGALGVGGSGGSGGCYSAHNCLCGYENGCYGGAGGGGYYGGGGGGGGGAAYASIYGAPGGGGGGGSSYVEPSATDVHFWSNWKNASGDGLVVFSWK
jgi:hypothetical protein